MKITVSDFILGVAVKLLDWGCPDLSPLHPLLQVSHQSGHVFIRLSVSTVGFLSATTTAT